MSAETGQLSAEERAERAERALAAALDERNDLWAELERRKANDEELAYWRSAYEDLRVSLSWRLTRPLRVFKGLFGAVRRDAPKARARLRAARRGD
jgi:hypothetical protein